MILGKPEHGESVVGDVVAEAQQQLAVTVAERVRWEKSRPIASGDGLCLRLRHSARCIHKRKTIRGERAEVIAQFKYATYVAEYSNVANAVQGGRRGDENVVYDFCLG